MRWAAILIVLCVSPLCAEEPNKEQKEAELKAKDDEHDASVGEAVPALTHLEGVLQLETSQQKPGIAGVLQTDKGAVALKIERSDLLEELQKFKGQKIKLAGRYRRGGKYFLVELIPETPNVSTGGEMGSPTSL